jgi:hypothetical protein
MSNLLEVDRNGRGKYHNTQVNAPINSHGTTEPKSPSPTGVLIIELITSERDTPPKGRFRRASI